MVTQRFTSKKDANSFIKSMGGNITDEFGFTHKAIPKKQKDGLYFIDSGEKILKRFV